MPKITKRFAGEVKGEALTSSLFLVSYRLVINIGTSSNHKDLLSIVNAVDEADAENKLRDHYSTFEQTVYVTVNYINKAIG